MHDNRWPIIGLVLLSSLVMSFVFTMLFHPSQERSALAQDVVESPAASGGGAPSPVGGEGFVRVVETAGPAVVYIDVVKRVDVPSRPFFDPGWDPFFHDFFGAPRQQPRRRQYEQKGLGSGFIVDAREGYVLTNNHVIDGADEITVTLHDGTKLKAKVVGTDPRTDVGVIQLQDFERGALRDLPLADSDAIRVGEWVLAIGNPFGLKQTVTSGIVSAKGRANVNIAEYEDFIQTDAAINPGNSGGPLVNLAGEAIGMNTAIFSRSGGDMGIGFAVPANMLKVVMGQLLKGGKIERGRVGIMIQNMTPELKEHFDFDLDGGVLISEVVPDGAAARAGLKAGDVILAIDGKPMREVSLVKNLIGFTPVGAELEVEIWRAGEKLEIDVRVERDAGADSETRRDLEASLGLSVSSLADKPNAEHDHGVYVEKVDPSGRAAMSGLRRGDVVLEVNREPVKDADHFFERVDGAKDDASMLFLIERRGHRIFLLVRNR